MKRREGREIGIEETEKLLKFLARNRVYPFCTKNDRIYFFRGNMISDEFKRHAIEKLDLKTDGDCKRVREAIKEEILKSGLKSNKPIKEWVREERLREMLVEHGAEKLSAAKLLAIIIRTGSDGIGAEDLARKLINHFVSLRAIDQPQSTNYVR